MSVMLFVRSSTILLRGIASSNTTDVGRLPQRAQLLLVSLQSSSLAQSILRFPSAFLHPSPLFIREVHGRRAGQSEELADQICALPAVALVFFFEILSGFLSNLVLVRRRRQNSKKQMFKF